MERIAEFDSRPSTPPPVHGRHWELTSYEWDGRTGMSRYGYTHRYTGKQCTSFHMQSKYILTDGQRRLLENDR